MATFSCSSFDVHVVLAFSVPVLAFVLRRSRSHPRSVPAVVRPRFRANVPRRSPPCSHPFAPCGAPGRVHHSCSASVFIFRRSRRVHSIGSQSTGSRFRVTFRREEASIAFRPSRLHPHPAITLVLVFRRSRSPCRTAFAFRLRLSTPPFRVRRTMTSFGHAHLSIYTLEVGHRCACVSSALFETDFRSHRSLHNLPTPCDADRPLPLRHRNRCASLDAHDPSALPCSRSRTFSCCSRVSTEKHVYARVRFPPRGVQHLAAPARTHSLRAFIFSVLSSRKFGLFVSDQAALLELLSLPTRPPGSQTPQLSPHHPPPRKISLVRLAALPTR